MRISDWSSDVCSSDLGSPAADRRGDRSVHAAAGGDPRSRGRRGGPRPRRRGAHRPPVPAGQRDAARRRPRRRRARRGSRPGTVGGGRDVPSAARAGGGAVSTAIEIAAAVRAGERTARSVVEEHLAAIEARESELHAFNLVTADAALAAADAVDADVAAGHDPGPLAGVPIALKDNLCTSGIPTTCSSKILEGWRPPYDATVVQRLAAAGAISVGKTHPDDFALGPSPENSAFWPTPHPTPPTQAPSPPPPP